MKKHAAQRGSLVAGRLRPRRRPPAAAPAARTTLRVNHAPHADVVEPHATRSRACSGGIDVVEHMLQAVSTACGIIDRIIARLSQLLDAMPENQPLAGHDSASDDWRATVPVVIRDVAALARHAAFNGAALLDGTWSPALIDPQTGEVRSVTVQSFAPQDLGNERLGGRLACLAHVETSRCIDPLIAARIVRCAIVQSLAMRRELCAFVEETGRPLRETLSVVQANVDAAQTTAFDADFAAVLGQLTPADALAQSQPAQAKPARSGLRLSSPHESCE